MPENVPRRKAVPVTDAERAAIAAELAAGRSVREVARQFDRSASVVSKVGKQAGIDVAGRAQTKAATAAKQADLAARRAALASGLLDDAERLRAQLFAPCTVHSFGGRDNTYNEHDLPEPTFADKRAIVAAVRMASTTSMDLVRADTLNENYAMVDEWLRSMIGTAG